MSRIPDHTHHDQPNAEALDKGLRDLVRILARQAAREWVAETDAAVASLSLQRDEHDG